MEANLTETNNVAPTVRSEAPISWYRPAMDVLESRDGVQLVVDLPGVPPDAIQVQSENLTLTVQGVRQDRRIGWRRALALPATVDTTRIEARSENGVLYLTIPLLEAAKPRKIEVK
jgi:HSP20 family protein